jgi:RNA recognition motif-containing protein
LQKTFDSNLFIRNVPSSVSEDEVKKVFEKVGPIVSLKKRTGKNVQAAYVQYFILYADVNHAKKAIQEYDQSNVFGSRLLNVEFWESPEEQAEKREQRQMRQMKQIFFEPKQPYEQRMDAMGQQRGGFQQRGRGGKNMNPRQGGVPYNQGPRGQPMQPPMQQPIMMQSNFPQFGGGFQGQPMQQPQPIQIDAATKQQIGDRIYPFVA